MNFLAKQDGTFGVAIHRAVLLLTSLDPVGCQLGDSLVNGIVDVYLEPWWSKHVINEVSLSVAPVIANLA